ncbi:Diacylglycerol O-acyltransferase 2A-like protein [Hapsidospora chrysogenum ATCC 11550]|uniref:Diacylglycerol O-acyltransferase n=1 Tax=Hapsidospora chrysogenum (strain ATCC 11550 / CBS 779.69 / DSM 880 / IAM 14645 / JCM 23072 / IMI 49137) TaxID=857340 RepID=A0A086STA1_HAPC1|nr:Diacylglycerol O-acyltransferase 2A-like protein [Hapsidospora chrysogenum ATCC 11550]
MPMATIAGPDAVQVQDVPLVNETNEKVTVMPNPANGHTVNGDDPGVEIPESEPRHQAPTTNGVSSRSRTPVNNVNGTTKSYADAAATADHDDRRDAAPSRQSTLRSLNERHAEETEAAWRAGGIRFAPVQVPLVRRMQTAAVLFHSMSIVLMVSAFWFTCANPFAWPILIPYLIHLSVSTAATNGTLAYRSEYLRSLPIWKLFAGYFPATLHKTHDLPPNRKYILGYHPHGIISHGAWSAFATNALGFADKFPGITNSLLTLDSNFRLPFYRDWLLLMGVRSVSKESIANTLSKGGPNNDGAGRAVTIVIGGARESLEAQPGTLRLILRGRKGFVKMALRTGADLVPVLAFGENDLYDQLSPHTHPMVHRLQIFLLKVFKFTVPALHGRGVLNYDVGLMPYRRPVNVVVGRPIQVDRPRGSEQPTQEEIDRLHELYVREVERLWDTYKDQFSPVRTSEMKIIS